MEVSGERKRDAFCQGESLTQSRGEYRKIGVVVLIFLLAKFDDLSTHRKHHPLRFLVLAVGVVEELSS